MKEDFPPLCYEKSGNIVENIFASSNADSYKIKSFSEWNGEKVTIIFNY